jgi:hypothetical protein
MDLIVTSQQTMAHAQPRIRWWQARSYSSSTAANNVWAFTSILARVAMIVVVDYVLISWLIEYCNCWSSYEGGWGEF